MTKIDFLSDNTTNDLAIFGGDFKVGDATNLQARNILESSKGEFRQYALLGLDINKYLGSTIDRSLLTHLIRKELEKDDIGLFDISFVDNGNSVEFDVNVL